MQAAAPLQPYSVERREVGPHDVRIEILYCGICHSDLHQVHDDWKGGIYPMVPGHEIIGRVAEVGASVHRFQTGMLTGVGCLVDSCRSCGPCQQHEEQYCVSGCVMTYNSYERDSKTPTFGGYSKQVVVDERYVLQVSDKLELSAVAPLLCAGITTFSPLKRFATKPKSRIGVMGLGGLGHMAVKIAAAMGHEVCMLSTSAKKAADAKRLGAHDFVLTTDADAERRLRRRFDLILNTVSAPHDVGAALNYLDLHGTMVILGAPPHGTQLHPGALIGGATQVAGSLVGGIKQTQEMLDFCAAHHLTADVELCGADEVNTAFARLRKNDVKYRFVIDMQTLN